MSYDKKFRKLIENLTDGESLVFYLYRGCKAASIVTKEVSGYSVYDKTFFNKNAYQYCFGSCIEEVDKVLEIMEKKFAYKTNEYAKDFIPSSCKRIFVNW